MINKLPMKERPGGGLRTLMLSLQQEVRELHAYVEGNAWITSSQACQLYEISEPTLKHWYDSGEIGRSEVGRIIRYKKSELDDYFERNYLKKKR